jgi:hypothetical protein
MAGDRGPSNLNENELSFFINSGRNLSPMSRSAYIKTPPKMSRQAKVRHLMEEPENEKRTL